MCVTVYMHVFPLSYTHMYVHVRHVHCIHEPAQVECDLQSRLSRSEGEVRRLGSQLAVLQNTIRDQRNTHSQDKDTLMSVNNIHVHVYMYSAKFSEVHNFRRSCTCTCIETAFADQGNPVSHAFYLRLFTAPNLHGSRPILCVCVWCVFVVVSIVQPWTR